MNRMRYRDVCVVAFSVTFISSSLALFIVRLIGAEQNRQECEVIYVVAARTNAGRYKYSR